MGSARTNTALKQRLESTRRRHLASVGSDRFAVDSPLEALWSPVVIRIATAGDRASLERLAELDSSAAPTGEMLIGELGKRAVAALSLSDGDVIADPFVPTSDVLALLRLRAAQLNRP
jgi:hypothetical protein